MRLPRSVWVGALLALSLATSAGEKRAVRFCAVGDVLLDRGVRMAIKKDGPEALLLDVTPILKGTDLALFNLECPVSDLGDLVTKRYSFRGDPSALPALKNAGLNIAGLANNHTLDCGREALLDTIARLEGAGIMTVGAGKDQESAERGRIIAVHGVKVAILAFAAMPIEGMVEAPEKPSLARASEETVSRAIGRAKRKAHMVVVTFHWGPEFQGVPSVNQRALAHLAVESGADLVLGHHPHVLQGIERYRGKLIVYSLGSFLFDLHRPEARLSAIFVCTLGKKGVTDAQIIPVIADPAHPRPASGEEATEVLERIASLSDGGGAILVRATGHLQLH